MAKRSRVSTQEQILMKEQEIKTQNDLLDKLNLELNELEAIKLQEDKDELYNMINKTGLTKVELEKLLMQIAISKQNKVVQKVSNNVINNSQQAS